MLTAVSIQIILLAANFGAHCITLFLEENHVELNISQVGGFLHTFKLSGGGF